MKKSIVALMIILLLGGFLLPEQAVLASPNITAENTSGSSIDNGRTNSNPTAKDTGTANDLKNINISIPKSELAEGETTKAIIISQNGDEWDYDKNSDDIAVAVPKTYLNDGETIKAIIIKQNGDKWDYDKNPDNFVVNIPKNYFSDGETSKVIQLNKVSDGWVYEKVLKGNTITIDELEQDKAKDTKIIQLKLSNNNVWEYDNQVKTGMIHFGWILLAVVAVLSLIVNSILIFANRH